MTTRRRFLQTAGSSALIALSPGVPQMLLHAAADQRAARGDRILVVVQLTGGNDGLNTVVPFASEAYYRARPKLAIAKADVLRVSDELGLHPSLRGFAELLGDGRLSIVQGVGYPQPDRSHFTSMDYWHTAQLELRGKETGWLGRSLDANLPAAGADVPALHLGPEKQPLALAGRDVHASSIQTLAGFRLELPAGDSLREEIRSAAASERAPEELLSFVQSSTSAALVASDRVQHALDRYQTPVNYPGTDLAQKLRSVAQLIESGFATRIYYVALDGFDTHSQQAGVHGKLLEQLSGAVKAFVDDLAHHGHLDRVAVLMFSEFGRRVAENASGGTDHGAAAPVFVAGGGLRAGLVGGQPALDDLADGDLKHHTDFRQVYAAVLDEWLTWPSAPILGAKFDPAAIFQRGEKA